MGTGHCNSSFATEGSNKKLMIFIMDLPSHVMGYISANNITVFAITRCVRAFLANNITLYVVT